MTPLNGISSGKMPNNPENGMKVGLSNHVHLSAQKRFELS